MGRPSGSRDHGSNRGEGRIRWNEGKTLLRLVSRIVRSRLLSRAE